MALNLKHTVIALAAALPLTLAGCSDSAPGKSEVKAAMEATLNQQIDQLKGLAAQLGNDEQKNELDKLQFQVDLDKVSDCKKNDADAQDDQQGQNGEEGQASEESQADQEQWTCHVTGKITVDQETQNIDDDVTLIKNDDGQWIAQ
ncbi:hypothetical protein [Phytohalomonas tamaricis]|uniref:hypothetical protein n=1 Tax=Phytohalomonas tamaricis TaxID=2081032 RepID=UPI000D0B2B19|nr:hypothetical protein [Phytohalomonas tamaricis]